MESEQEALELAWSFSGLYPPNNANLEYTHVEDGKITYLYRDKNGDWWYQTERARKFEEEMLELQRKRKKAKEEERKANYVSVWQRTKENDAFFRDDQYKTGDYCTSGGERAKNSERGTEMDSGVPEGRAI